MNRIENEEHQGRFMAWREPRLNEAADVVLPQQA
jgi:hypothetical protein